MWPANHARLPVLEYRMFTHNVQGVPVAATVRIITTCPSRAPIPKLGIAGMCDEGTSHNWRATGPIGRIVKHNPEVALPRQALPLTFTLKETVHT
jgi:hypothetical protein